jgi:hypothetical protein
MEAPTEALLIITGTMGAGKSAVLGEASDLLAQRRIVHAAIDLDALGLAYLPGATPGDAVMYQNLRFIVSNYAAAGVERFLVARALEDRAQLDLCREIIPTANTRVCRLTASLETAERRVGARDLGIFQEEYVGRVRELDAILDGAGLEDFTVANDNRALTEVALEVLTRAGWIPGQR